jgi:hypothetical protein
VIAEVAKISDTLGKSLERRRHSLKRLSCGGILLLLDGVDMLHELPDVGLRCRRRGRLVLIRVCR